VQVIWEPKHRRSVAFQMSARDTLRRAGLGRPDHNQALLCGGNVTNSKITEVPVRVWLRATASMHYERAPRFRRYEAGWRRLRAELRGRRVVRPGGPQCLLLPVQFARQVQRDNSEDHSRAGISSSFCA